MKNWSRLKRWTRSGDWGDVEYLRLAYQAYAAKQSRHRRRTRSLTLFGNRPNAPRTDQPERQADLARLAMKWNLTSEAERSVAAGFEEPADSSRSARHTGSNYRAE